jgi:pimeloyl-ACP methyl ester carboxylesterase
VSRITGHRSTTGRVGSPLGDTGLGGMNGLRPLVCAPQLTRRRAAAITLAVLMGLLTACAAAPASRGSVAASASTQVISSSVTAPASTQASPTTAPHPSEPVDELVAVDGGRLHVRCVGSGDATIVLIAGFSDGGDNWGSITPALSSQARVCWYARFGTGTSDPPPIPQTFTSQATDLHALLSAIGEPGPYLVVGHSYGGAEAVAFASQYADQVRGLVLLDASPIGWNAAVCAVPADGSDAAAGFQQSCAEGADPAHNPERLDVPAAFAEIAEIATLGRLPLAVLTASEHPWGLAAEEDARLSGVWDAGQARWASLSSSAQLIVVADSGHHIQLDQPLRVIEQVQRLLARQ